MRDAFGGLVNLVIIVVFLVLVSGYLAFNVSYTKAFKVKNRIISLYEQYEGVCNNPGDACVQEIDKYISEVGYNANNGLKGKKESEGYTCRMGYCYKLILTEKQEGLQTRKIAHYKIVTQVIVDIPIINKIMPQFDVFYVYGDTRTMEID